ncbi:unnamed protein product [Phytophthora fragariaefolia]|uniref:Unnamed protein product n=1 Tax=Phytophthora fragariaefolia TaxID=1490495 RepID=A0A9W7D0D9_9STRA|nr:unnamed protein product [Phytophthora fragariaefolia]
MPRNGTRSSAKAPAKKTAGAPKPKAKPRDQASALAEATAAASAAIQSPGASNAPSATHSRRSRSPDLPPDDRPNPRFAYRDHSPGSPADPERVLYSGDESDPHEAEGSHSAVSPAPAARTSREGDTRPSPSQSDPQAKAARTASDPDTESGQWSLPVRNLTLSEGLARVRGAATQHQGAVAAQEEPTTSRKRSASQSPRRKARDSFRGLVDSSSDDEEEEGAVTIDPAIALQQEEMRLFRDRLHAIEINTLAK